MWPQKKDQDGLVDADTLNITDAILDTVEDAMDVVEEEEATPSSAGFVQAFRNVVKSLWIFLVTEMQTWWGLLVQQTKELWSLLVVQVKEKGSLLVETAKERYHSFDRNELRSKLEENIVWLRAELHEWYLQLYTFLLLRYDIWIHHSSTAWIHQKTGIQPETIVTVLASLLFLTVIGLFCKFFWKRRPRRRRRAKRSMSRTESTKGARDRGFSLELSATQGGSQTHIAPRSRGFSFDHFFKRGEEKNPTTTNRKRGDSYDMFAQQDAGLMGDVDLNNPNHAIGHGIEEVSARPNITPLITFYGPTETTLRYNTWTPPPSWTEASRSLMPTDTRIKLQREISLDLSKDQCLISIREPSSRQTPLTLVLADCSIHVKTPLIGGVLEIYVKDSSKEEWMEHTFDTAKNAAQFQMDILALQLFGPALHRMYQTLELIHQGSMGTEGREYVCHHDEMSDEKPQGVGLAWDDVMRALGSNVPSLRVALERLWWHHYSMNSLLRERKQRARNKNQQNKKGNTKASSNSSVGSAPMESERDAGGEGGAEGTSGRSDASKKETLPIKDQNEYIHLTSDYVRRRLLMGPIDFFRLFVPNVLETALPNNESTQKRLVQLLRWRKRAATAAILVQGYVKARIVANRGWVLSRPLPTHYLTRRLAFDDNIDNSQRDVAIKNEYYEGTVSRDVLTFVRPNNPNAFRKKERLWEYLRPRKVRSAISKYQAFTQVGLHVFKIPQDDNFPLHPESDPVLVFGSLRHMIECNPDLEFFVIGFYPEFSKVCIVNVFVRSMPKGVDPAFDRVMSRYKHGSAEIRDKKLCMQMQFGSPEMKTWYEIAVIKGMTYLMSSVAGDMDTSAPPTDVGPSDRVPFPLIQLSKLGETHHFGGALQDDRKLPQNYCSVNMHIDSNKVPRFNPWVKLLISIIERGLMSKNVYDFSLVLTANQQDELPERALATARLVRVAAKDIALPSIFVYGSSRRDFHRRSSFDILNFKSVMGTMSYAGERLRASADYVRYEDEEEEDTEQGRPRSRSPSELHRKRQRAEALLESQKASTMITQDPVEKAVNELVEILGEVKIPVRRDQLPMYDFAANVPMSLLEAYNTTDGTLHDKELLSMSLLLLITRGDIQRHYVASGCNLKKAAIRIVETAAWRGQTFPIDLRMCRIELQSGQFFQQGTDISGRPVFYFRNMGLGPWRKNNDACVAAVLHRLEGALWEFSQQDDDVKCTLVVIMGKPYREYFNKRKGVMEEASIAGDEDEGDDDMSASMMSASFKDVGEDSPDGQRVANPRVNPDEVWQLHTSKKLIRQMCNLISAHYPERLYQALIVLKPRQTISLRKLVGSYTLSSFVESPVTKSKVKFLNTFLELQGYISKQELVTIAGGERPVNPEVFGLPD